MASVWKTIDSAPRDHFPKLVWSKQGGLRRAFLDVTWTWWPIPAKAALRHQPTHWREDILLPETPEI